MEAPVAGAEALLPVVEDSDAAAQKRRTPSSHARLASLDVVRGLTIAVMIFVDDVGGAYPRLNHSPWDNVTLADFVMPWFLFMVGGSMSMSLRKFTRSGTRADRIAGTKSCLLRALKLFALGVLLQGGGWFDSHRYGFNLATMRWCGILNRIGYAYAVASLLELWLPELPSPASRSPHVSVFTVYALKWAAALLFVLVHLALTLGTYVPSWTSHYGPHANSTSVLLSTADTFEITCNVRGAIGSPECSAAGFYDRLLFGQDHLGYWMSARLPQCSSCAPGNPSALFRPTCHWCTHANMSGCPQQPPNWCFAHIYDPEGALATLPTVMSVWLGTHFGRGLKHAGLQGRAVPLVAHWAVCATILIGAGLAVHAAWLPMNKQLWSTSYLLFMAGTCGAALLVAYAVLDADLRPIHHSAFRRAARRACAPLEYMGMNSILVFFWHGSASALLNAVYYAPPAVGGGTTWSAAHGALCEADGGEPDGWLFHSMLRAIVPDPVPRQLVYVLLKVGCFMVGTWACFKCGYFWKI